MSQKENNNNRQNINMINNSNIPGIKSLKNIDNNTLNKNNSNNIKELENVKQEIINFYLIEQRKNEEKKREIELKKNLNNNIKRNKNINSKSKDKNRFEKYDKERLSYEIYHQYQKLNFDYKKIPFVPRMELYALKKCLKDYKIEELTNIKSPKMSEKKIIHAFNRLIDDSNRRNLKLINNNNETHNNKNNKNKKNNNKENEKAKIQKNKKNTKIKNTNNIKENNNNQNVIKKNPNNKVNKSFDKKKWDEIYERRFSSKLKERNEKLEKLRQEKEEKIKREEDLIIDNLNKKQDLINQKYGLKRSNSANNILKTKNDSYNNINKYYIGNNKMITNLNQRLYYNELNKKDINYITFMEKAQELLNDNNNDFFYYYGKDEKNNNLNSNVKNTKNIKIPNTFRVCANGIKNKKMVKSNSVYNFKDYLDSNENKNDEIKKTNNNIYKLINDNDINDIINNKNENKYNNHKFYEIKINKDNNTNNTKSDDIQDLVNYNNNKENNNNAERIIDRFFEG